jgi:hypothetical protein
MKIEQLREFLFYDPETGSVYWRVNRNGGASAGDEAGYIAPSGHRHMEIEGKTYTVHRVAWALHYGRWPDGEVDHRNRQRADNRIANLRDVNLFQQAQNRGMQRNNTSGTKGVTYAKNRNRWMAFITANGQSKTLGYYKTKEEAAAVRKAAEERLHGDYACAS